MGKRGGDHRIWVLIIALAATACPYNPKVVDCKVRCGEDNACPTGLTCEGGFCRPADAEGVCLCDPSEERSCGGGQGECKAGVQVCTNARVWGPCLGEVMGTAEICDLKDNDCNGAVDDMVTDAPTCPLNKGVCIGKSQQCVSGSYSGTCSPQEYGAAYEVAETRCDGVDNDCDGFVDGKRPQELVAFSFANDFVGFDGGYALAWVGDDAGLYAVNVRLFNAAMQPLGPALNLATTAASLQVTVVAYDRDVYVAWLDDNTLLSGGAFQIHANAPAIARSLPGFPGSGAWDETVVAANAFGLIGAYIVDGGINLNAWSKDGGAPSIRAAPLGPIGDPLVAQILGPPVFDEMSDVVLSSQAKAVAFESHYFYADGGIDSGDYLNRVAALDGSKTVDKYLNNTTLLDTGNGLVQTFFRSADCTLVFFIPQCTNSWVGGDLDIFNAASDDRKMRVQTDPTAIVNAEAAPAGNEWIGTWNERNALMIGRFDRAANALRYRQVDTDGGSAYFVNIGNSGGVMSALVYDTNPTTGSLSSVLACPP